MISIETLAHKLADKLTLQLDLDEDKNAVIAYGLIAIFQIASIFIIITIIGIIFDFWYESLIIFLGVGFIRKSTGGAHSSTMNGCNIISILSITILSALSRYLLCFPFNIYINLAASSFVFIICFIIFYLRVPVDSPNKPIVKPEKIKKLRKQSFLKLTLLFLISIVFIILADSYKRFYSITSSIRLTMLWQLLTLTQIGNLFLDKIDTKINWIIEKK